MSKNGSIFSQNSRTLIKSKPNIKQKLWSNMVSQMIRVNSQSDQLISTCFVLIGCKLWTANQKLWDSGQYFEKYCLGTKNTNKNMIEQSSKLLSRTNSYQCMHAMQRPKKWPLHYTFLWKIMAFSLQKSAKNWIFTQKWTIYKVFLLAKIGALIWLRALSQFALFCNNGNQFWQADIRICAQSSTKYLKNIPDIG